MATTKEQLFADLKKDGISNYNDQITKAKNGDGAAMDYIGWEYQYTKSKYDKAMAWYRLAAAKNNSAAQNNIGNMYENGRGVPVDYLLAMEWYLKAAIQNNESACLNIAGLFEDGLGVPVNKYKALEWYTQWDEGSYRFNELTKQGIQLTQQDKNKSIEQLVKEAEDIAWPGKRLNIERQLKEEINTLKQLMNKMEEESNAKDSKIKTLQEVVQTFQAIAEDKQQEINTLRESNDQYKTKEQTINNELLVLKQDNHILKLKMEEETRAKNNEINSLKEEVQTFRAITEDKQQEISTLIESINQFKQKEQTIHNEVQSFKQVNHTLELKLEAKENKVTLLEKEIKLLLTVSENSSQGTTERVKELKKSNQGLERMLEQERQLKDNQIEVMKDKMEIALEKEKQKRNKLERKYRAIQRELRNMKTPTQTSIPKQIAIKSEKNEDNNISSGDNETDNETDYDTEYDSAGSDINHDTPSEEDDGDDNGNDGENENDLNYDSDEQSKNRKNIPSVQSAGGSRK